MKTTLRNSPAVLLSFLAVFIFIDSGASENLILTPMEDSRTLIMEISRPLDNAMHLYLLDNKNNTIYSEVVSSGTSYRNLLKFADLKNGRYTLVSEVGDVKFNRVFKVRDSGLKLVDSYYTSTPYFKLEDGVILLHFLNGSGNNVKVVIEDVMLEKRYELNYTGEQIFSKALSVQKLNMGTYTLKLSSGNELYSYGFEVE